MHVGYLYIYVRHIIKTAIFDYHYSYLTSNWIKYVSLYRKEHLILDQTSLNDDIVIAIKTFIIYVGILSSNKLLITDIIFWQWTKYYIL